MAALRQAVSRNLRELRIHLCQSSRSSQGTRDFIENHYVSLKQQNPTFPILIRECSGVEPKLYGRFAFGQERCVSLANMDGQQVMLALEQLVNE